MIRQGVGAIVIHNRRFLLAERVMALGKDGKPESIRPEWDLVKGGIEEGEEPTAALMRELTEETGSTKFRIIKRYGEALEYPFSLAMAEKTGFEGQHVEMFHVVYLGKTSELKCSTGEIRGLRFFSRQEALSLLKYPETRSFFTRTAPQ